jgi:two-component system cell cycle response regulator DivK
MQQEFSTKNIMIVEDNPVNQKVIQKLVKIFGHNSINISDGHQVIDLVRDNRPDLILMDVQLVDISGIDLTKIIKADPDLKSIPVIIITAFATIDDKARIIEQSNCDDFLAKPFSPDELAEKISRFFAVKKF